jgi:NADP-dependent 3-hydroxy acid dehydrogenase YdfG
VLAGRSAGSDAVRHTLAELRAKGAAVTIVQADVAKHDGVAEMFSVADAQAAPLRGVVHAAGVLDDGLIADLTAERIARVMAPKATGAWLLHEFCANRELDQFVLFSSAAATLGSRGQANYAAANAFLDGLAQLRKASGLPATSIGWGAWAEVGMAARAETVRKAEARGVRAIQPQQGLVALDVLMAARPVHAAVLPVDWHRALEGFASGTEPPILSEIAVTVRAMRSSQSGSTPIRSRLVESSAEQREELLLTYLREQIARALGMASADKLDMDLPLSQAGFDSLIAVELRNRIDMDLDISLAPGVLFGDTTVRQIASEVSRLWVAPSAGTREAPNATQLVTTDPSHLLSRVDQLADSQVEALLQKLLADVKNDK